VRSLSTILLPPRSLPCSPKAKITGVNICPIYGCADFTMPLGQVSYFSNVTCHEEMILVTINMVVNRTAILFAEHDQEAHGRNNLEMVKPSRRHYSASQAEVSLSIR